MSEKAVLDVNDSRQVNRVVDVTSRVLKLESTIDDVIARDILVGEMPILQSVEL